MFLSFLDTSFPVRGQLGCYIPTSCQVSIQDLLYQYRSTAGAGYHP
jgi:hypothetical protein